MIKQKKIEVKDVLEETIPIHSLKHYNSFYSFADETKLFCKIGANNVGVFNMDGKDEKYVIVIKALAESTVTIDHGNGIQGTMDIVSDPIPQNNYTFITVESGRVKNVTGNNSGKVIIRATADTNIAVIELP